MIAQFEKWMFAGGKQMESGIVYPLKEIFNTSRSDEQTFSAAAKGKETALSDASVERIIIGIKEKKDVINLSRESIGNDGIEIVRRIKDILNNGDRAWAVIEHETLLVITGSRGKMAYLVRDAKQTSLRLRSNQIGAGA